MNEPAWEFIRGDWAICMTPNVMLPDGGRCETYAEPGDSFVIAGYLDVDWFDERLLVLQRGEGAELFTAHWSHFRITDGPGC